VQKRPGGLPEAYVLGEDFLDGGASALVLGDNIFEDDFTEAIGSFVSGGRIFAKRVPDPERFGVVAFDDATKRAISIEEKPVVPKSDYAVPGLYLYDGRASEIARGLSPSERGELEIVDMHRAYLDLGELDVRTLEGGWFDAGTHDSLLEASVYVKDRDFRSRFHPIVNEAIAGFNAEFKRLVSL